MYMVLFVRYFSLAVRIFVRFDIRIPLHFCNFEEYEEKLNLYAKWNIFLSNPMQLLAAYSFNGQVQGG